MSSASHASMVRASDGPGRGIGQGRLSARHIATEPRYGRSRSDTVRGRGSHCIQALQPHLLGHRESAGKGKSGHADGCSSGLGVLSGLCLATSSPSNPPGRTRIQPVEASQPDSPAPPIAVLLALPCVCRPRYGSFKAQVFEPSSAAFRFPAGAFGKTRIGATAPSAPEEALHRPHGATVAGGGSEPPPAPRGREPGTMSHRSRGCPEPAQSEAAMCSWPSESWCRRRHGRSACLAPASGVRVPRPRPRRHCASALGLRHRGGETRAGDPHLDASGSRNSHKGIGMGHRSAPQGNACSPEGPPIARFESWHDYHWHRLSGAKKRGWFRTTPSVSSCGPTAPP